MRRSVGRAVRLGRGQWGGRIGESREEKEGESREEREVNGFLLHNQRSPLSSTLSSG